MTIGHILRRSTVPTPNRDTSRSWALKRVVCIYCIARYCSSYPLPVWPPVATIHPLGRRSFSRGYPVHHTPPCHLLPRASFPPLQHILFRLAHFTFSHFVSSALCCFTTRTHACIYFLLLPATGIPFSSVWQAQVPEVTIFERSRIYELH